MNGEKKFKYDTMTRWECKNNSGLMPDCPGSKPEKRSFSRDAKLILIYCEGRKREPQYFNRFREISSRIRVEIVLPDETGDNSPTGLYQRAVDNTEYEILADDEVWFVIDTDTWLWRSHKLRRFRSDKLRRWFTSKFTRKGIFWLPT